MDAILSYVLPIVIILLIVGVIVFYAIWLTRKMNRKTTEDNTGRDYNKRDRKGITITPYGAFIGTRKSDFHSALRKALPSNYVIIPNVAIELLFKSDSRHDLHMEGQYADFGIFTEKWIPILLIFLVDYSPIGKQAFKITQDVKEMVNAINVQTMEYGVKENYSIDDLRKSIAKAMNPLYDK